MSRPNKTLREKILKEFNNLCANCGKENEKLNPLQIHHLDDNPNNNKIENLVVLCISCHNKTKNIHSKYRERVTKGNYYLVPLI